VACCELHLAEHQKMEMKSCKNLAFLILQAEMKTKSKILGFSVLCGKMKALWTWWKQCVLAAQ
jgi:hypothetical protein